MDNLINKAKSRSVEIAFTAGTIVVCGLIITVTVISLLEDKWLVGKYVKPFPEGDKNNVYDIKTDPALVLKKEDCI